LQGVDFAVVGRDVDLSGANFRHADLTVSELGKVKLDNAKLSEAQLPLHWSRAGTTDFRGRRYTRAQIDRDCR
jgi:uncharacterized protein YjbI with pentapeptide repeats